MKAIISSTIRDLPEHRRQVVEACLREHVFPLGMEQLPARDATGVQVSLELVDQADVYIGVYAWRYGWIPPGSNVSITEMELDRAIERRRGGHLKEICIFTMAPEHPLTIADIEVSDGAPAKLAAFKARATVGRVRREFRSPEDLRGLVVEALADCRRRWDTTAATQGLHAESHIPKAPDRYVAHPYTLLSTKGVVGRKSELDALTEWARATSNAAPAPIAAVVAIGGMGKSAVTWKWFHDAAPAALPTLAGRMWWSFYESDAHWENFVLRALAYTSGLPEADLKRATPLEREERLLGQLDQRQFLVVLDGLERILLAYSRLDAAVVGDEQLDEQTANLIPLAEDASAETRATYREKHRMRRCTNTRVGEFLAKLTHVRASRVLISTRLFPADLETETGDIRNGCHRLILDSLSDDDALALWRAFVGAQNAESVPELLHLFRSFGNYPLLLRALAGEVAHFRPAPGDFSAWSRANPGFNPYGLPLENARSHVLAYALQGLNPTDRRVLTTLAAFRMPAAWETVTALQVGEGRPCHDDGELDRTLTSLEDRGLVGWDKRANRYDLHPVVRSVVWKGVGRADRRVIYELLHDHFQAMPRLAWQDVHAAEDLTPGIELYCTLIGLERYDDAYAVWRDRLDYATLWRLNLSRERTEMLALLFPRGITALPQLGKRSHQSYVLNALATGYDGLGMPRKAIPLYERAAQIEEGELQWTTLSEFLNDLSSAHSACGELYRAETVLHRALEASRRGADLVQECWTLVRLAILSRQRGEPARFALLLARADAISRVANTAEDRHYYLGVSAALRAELALCHGQVSLAVSLAKVALEEAQVEKIEGDFIRAARLLGLAALASGEASELPVAREHLTYALARARTTNSIQEEIALVTALAELHRRCGESEAAHELLDGIWTAAEAGPYPLSDAEARLVLARLHRDAGRLGPAIDAATRGYELAWCDGPPHSFQHGLDRAAALLTELGAEPPELPAFDPTNEPPMPHVDVNPRDEHWVSI